MLGMILIRQYTSCLLYFMKLYIYSERSYSVKISMNFWIRPAGLWILHPMSCNCRINSGRLYSIVGEIRLGLPVIVWIQNPKRYTLEMLLRNIKSRTKIMTINPAFEFIVKRMSLMQLLKTAIYNGCNFLN